MSTKSINVKNFVKDAGVKNQLFVFAGYNPNVSVSEANQSSIDLWNYSDFSVRIGKPNVMPVVPNVKWSQSKPYTPWSSVNPNSGNFYALNEQNGYVYLCVSDNLSNRTDHNGTVVSNVRPTHSAGIERYSDGFAWKPLYKITPSLEKFVSNSWLPVVSFEFFDASTQDTFGKLTKAFCSPSSPNTIGQCALYAKIALNQDDDATVIEYEKGDLFCTAKDLSCAQCYYLTVNDDKYESVYYEDGETVPQTKQILDNYDLISSYIDTGEISPSSPYYYLYQINANDNLNEGGVVSAFIDLSGFSTSQLITTSSNPEFAITSNSGYGARIRLRTTINNGSYIISGIEVLEGGYYYKDITLEMDPNSISIDSDMLVSAIQVNLDTIDGLGFDPVDVLNAQHVMVDARIEKKTINDATSIILPDKLNFFGLVQNPSSTVGTNIITSGSNKNQKLDIVYRTTILAEVSTDTSITLPTTDNIYNTQGVNSTNPSVTSSTTNGVFIGGVGGINEGGVASFYIASELKNVAYAKANSLVGVTLANNVTITAVYQQPEFIQYTGKILSVKKLNTDLPISDVDSVIIRINMIKGM